MYNWIPQDESLIFGYSRLDSRKEGKTAAYLESIGMYGLTIESGQGLKFNPDYKVYDNPSFVIATTYFGETLRFLIKNCSINYNSKT